VISLLKNYLNCGEGFKEKLEEGEIPDVTPDGGLEL
jgi:hypothetical protein